MSEKRQSFEIWKRYFLPSETYKKTSERAWGNVSKIELFPARFFAGKWEPASESFYPKPPLHGVKRKEYWETRYRVRLGGKWYGDRAKYQTFTKEQIFKRLMT